MKICFITTMVYKDGGVSRVLSALASALASEHDVTVATFENRVVDNLDKYNLSPKVNVDFLKPYYQKCYFRRFLHKINQKTGICKRVNSDTLWKYIYIPKKMQQTWVKYITDNKFDVVVGVQGKCSFFLGSISDSVSCKTFGWQHNSYEAYFEQPGRNYYWNQDYLFEKYIPKLDKYIVLNEHDEKMFKEKKGLDTITIYNPRSFVSNEKAELVTKRFVGVGGLRPAKGFDLLLEAFSEFANTNSDWILDIYGDGAEKENLQVTIDKLGLGSRVCLKGVTNDIRTEMLNSSGLLLSSRWEGMPMVVLEALETGLPTIAFDITAITPLITTGIEGIVVKSFDTHEFSEAMLQLANDAELRQSMGKNASLKSECFDIVRIKEQWLHVLEEN